MKTAAAFYFGLVEFRSDFTRHYDGVLIEVYDTARDFAHWITFRYWDGV
ncbi:hypothetical protein LCGC14_2493870 [marine sediment metagenome]|uniref:Uncharacterized protein n=1 Tax=marine sediment metagenome TaxID=412755 RepID=A0A0F9B4M1_9ZZZZ